jgi:hypothetical protein
MRQFLRRTVFQSPLMPAKAGIQLSDWVPAFAGTSGGGADSVGTKNALAVKCAVRLVFGDSGLHAGASAGTRLRLGREICTKRVEGGAKMRAQPVTLLPHRLENHSVTVLPRFCPGPVEARIHQLNQSVVSLLARCNRAVRYGGLAQPNVDLRGARPEKSLIKGWQSARGRGGLVLGSQAQKARGV